MVKDEIQRAREKFCSTFESKIFIAVATALAVAEPVLVAFEPVTLNLTIQIIVLALATSSLFIDLAVTAMYMHTKKQSSIVINASLVLLKGEVIFEFFCLAFGWIFIFIRPGIAALRCFRLLRLFWHYNAAYNSSETKGVLKTSLTSFLSDGFVRHLEGVGKELFTFHSRGGVILLTLFFYFTYVLAVVFWMEFGNMTTPDGYLCDNIGTCFITLMRLAFYDTVGFDFLVGIVDSGKAGPGYALLLIAYMCFTSMVLLNGLIGIFGAVFARDTSQNELLLEDKSVSADSLDEPTKNGNDDLSPTEARKHFETLREDVQKIKSDMIWMKECLSKISSRLETSLVKPQQTPIQVDQYQSASKGGSESLLAALSARVDGSHQYQPHSKQGHATGQAQASAASLPFPQFDLHQPADPMSNYQQQPRADSRSHSNQLPPRYPPHNEGQHQIAPAMSQVLLDLPSGLLVSPPRSSSHRDQQSIQLHSPKSLSPMRNQTENAFDIQSQGSPQRQHDFRREASEGRLPPVRVVKNRIVRNLGGI